MAEQYSAARRFPKAIVNVTTEVVVERDEASTSVDGRFLILGGGGAWIEMTGQYPIDSEVALRFKLPRGATDIACRAVVRNRMHRRGAGVEFVDITPDDRESVIAFVARQTGGASPPAAG